MRCPLRLISPWVGGSAPEMTFTQVDLPEPLGPISPTTSRAPTAKLMPLSAVTPPKVLRHRSAQARAVCSRSCCNLDCRRARDGHLHGPVPQELPDAAHTVDRCGTLRRRQILPNGLRSMCSSHRPVCICKPSRCRWARQRPGCRIECLQRPSRSQGRCPSIADEEGAAVAHESLGCGFFCVFIFRKRSKTTFLLESNRTD